MSSTFAAVDSPQVSPDRDSMLRRVLTPKPHFMLTKAGEDERPSIEAFVAEKFQVAWQSRVTSFMPWLLSMHCLGHCSAVAGIRLAEQQRLFLERYLDNNIEVALAAASGSAINRSAIAEIGNLAANQRGASHLLFLVFTVALHRAGYRWIVFTATRALRNNLDKLGFPLLALAPAAPDRLDATELEEWGSYYQSEPLVMAGNLDDAMAIIETRPLLRRVLRLYRYRINELAARLRGDDE